MKKPTTQKDDRKYCNEKQAKILDLLLKEFDDAIPFWIEW